MAARPISRPRFMADLARCAGVIANAGFTLTSECLHLGIAVLVRPIHGQLEQESNARRPRSGWDSAPCPATCTGRTCSAGWRNLRRRPRTIPTSPGALIDWLDAGAGEPLRALSDRLWAADRR